jgi:hypothetical protein
LVTSKKEIGEYMNTPLKEKYRYLDDSSWWAEQIRKGYEQYLQSEAHKQVEKETMETLVAQAIVAVMRVAEKAVDARMYPDDSARKRLPKPYDWKGEELDTSLYRPAYGEGETEGE